MTITAKEAHSLSEQNLSDTLNKIVSRIDTMIDQAICDCKFSVTTPIMTKSQAQFIIERYTDLGYEVVDYNNNMFGISW